MGISERISYVRNFIKLKQQEEIIEKGNELFMNNLKINPSILKNLKEEYDLCSKERNEILDQLRGKISEYNLEFNKIQEIVDKFHDGKVIDINSCKTKMVNFLEKLDNFEVTEELEKLEKEQKELEDFYYEFKANIAKIEAQKQLRIRESFVSSSRCSAIKKDCKRDTTKYEEIKDFESLVFQTGHTQNWKDEDHRLFIKIRNKYHNISEIVTEFQKKCPDISVEQIVNHEAWYKIYLNLREKQRSLVKEWRMKKELEKKEKLEAIKNTENKTGSEKADTKCEIKNNEIKFNSKINESTKIFRSCENTNDSLDKKELIRQWKIYKENMKKTDEEQMKRQKETERLKKEKKFHMRTLKIKEAVREYKQQKMKKISELALSKHNQNEQTIKTPKIINNFRKRDKIFIKKRLNLLHSKNNRILKKQWNNFDNKYIKKSNTRRLSDKSSLMKPTIIWSQKCRPEFSEDTGPKPVLYIKNIPKSSNNWRNQDSLTY
ncbi:coiled-coil domain-containing protein 112-like isoform X2 [Chelonus insularis]|uniref:coiled-coil domain-containing protein 112-like isoform X2 n=1 Tax=Chelonus insularis TaxID=460826 RepID=UPI00158AB087|nr:coiled-coil domain-containing protein 112-like isoform X2 [Chelonus insularis]